MLIVLSPAKSLDFSTEFNCPNSTKPRFESETSLLIENLKQLASDDLQKLMAISKKLGDLNHQRFQDFKNNFERQAILAFDGDVYDGIDKEKYREKDFNFAQKHVVILSGLYGLLRPLDLIKPHRLEMGTDFKNIKFFIKNLYDFWDEKIISEINKYPAKIIVNLASQEYFLAINSKKINKKIIEIVFQEKKDGTMKTIGINSKKARGLMTNFAIKNNIIDPQNLQKFHEENYRFNPSLSSDEKWFFTR
jgi:cytoplasmic iron level regulating protein YaaA (DUF328/UPF0246 family)